MKKFKVCNENLEIIYEDFMNSMPIIVPTDTNYNFICNPRDKKAIEKIFKLKERNRNKPLSLFVLDTEKIYEYGTGFDKKVLNKIIKTFLPGPLNIVLDKQTSDFDYMLNGEETIAFGSISNKNWRKVVQKVGGVVALTSANISGTADDCLVTEDMITNQMENKVDYFVENEITEQNTKSSTIIKINGNKIQLLREGDIKLQQIFDALDRENICYKKN